MGQIHPVVESAVDVKPEDVVAEIDLDEFEEDRRDPEWQDFLSKAKAYRARLRLEDRIDTPND